MSKKKIVINNLIQCDKLFGNRTDDLAKYHLTQEAVRQTEVIKGEEHLGITKLGAGAVIFIRESIGVDIANKFNSNQYKHIKNRTFSHKILCERKNESPAMLFITLQDMVGDLYYDKAYKSMSPQELYSVIQTNLCIILENELSWALSYSKAVIRDYYSIKLNKPKIKLNFLFGSHGENPGLLVKIVDDLEYYEKYTNFREPIGILCQILIPSGLPKNKKWTQIDIGIAVSGKRFYKETIPDALIREARSQIHIKVHKDILEQSTKCQANKFIYGADAMYDGYEIHIWEIFYPDQISIIDEFISYEFCCCANREKIINDHKSMLRSLKNSV